MAMGLKQRPEEDQREESLNPGARIEHDRVRDYEDGKPHHDNVDLRDDERDEFDRMTGGKDMDDLRDLEKNPDGPNAAKADSTTTSETNAKEDSPWETAVGDKGGSNNSGNFLSRNKKAFIIGGIVTSVGGLGIGLIFGLFNLMFINLKEIAYESSFKRSYTKSAQRSAKTMKATYFSNVDDCEGARCRYRSGVTQVEIDKLERMGVKVDSTPSSKPGRVTVNTITLRDGTVLNAGNFEQNFRDNPDVRAFAARARDVNGTFPRTVSSLKMMFERLGLSRKNPLAGENNPDRRTLIQKIRERTMKAYGGINTRVNNGPNEEGETTEDRLVSDDIQEAAQAERERLLNDPDAQPDPDLNPDIDDVARIGSGATTGALRGSARGTSIIGGLGTACEAYSLLKTLDIGAKLLISINLIRYASVFMSFADANKAGSELGEVTPGQIAAVADMALTEDDQGRNFFDAPLIQYILYGELPNPDSFSPYMTGAAFAGFITVLRQSIDDAFDGNAAGACRIVNNALVQLGAAALSLGLAVFTVGISAGISVITSAAGGAALGILESYVVPQLIKMAAGTIVTGDENGYDMANAIMAGMFVFAPQLSRAKGMVPMTKQQIAQDTKEVNELYYDFFPEKKRSQVANIAMNAGIFGARIFSDRSAVVQPQRILADAGNMIKSPEVFAVDAVGDSDHCKDPDYEGLATTPTCALIYSQPTAVIEDPAYSPEANCDFMLGYSCGLPDDQVPAEPPENAYINNATDEPTTNENGQRYANYVEVCMDSTVPLLDTQIEGIETYGETTREYCADEVPDEWSVPKKHWQMWRMDGDLIEDPKKVEEYLAEPLPGVGTGVGATGLTPVPCEANGGQTLTVGAGGQYPTISAAAGAAQAGDLVLISGGTYNERLEVPNSGADGRYISICGKPGEQVIITGGGGDRGQIGVTGKSYINFSNLVVSNAPNFGVYADGSSNLAFQNFSINGSQDGGLVILASSNILVDGCEIQGTNARGTSASHEALSIAEGSSNFEIKNCQVHDNGEEGIDAKYNANANGKIYNNTVWNNRGPNIYVDSAVGVEVYNNISYGATEGSKAGITIAAETSYGGANNPRRAADIRIYNNVLYGNAGGGIDFWTESGGTISNVSVFNNTIADNDKAAIRVSTGALSGNNPVFNNILIGGAGGNGLQMGNNFTGNAMFVNPGGGDYKLQAGSPAINTGQADGAPAFDLENKPRPAGGGVDMGAYEQ